MRAIRQAINAGTLCLAFSACGLGAPVAPLDVPVVSPPAVVPGPVGEVPVPTRSVGELVVPPESAVARPALRRCDLFHMVTEARELVAGIPVSLGPTEYRYVEERNGRMVSFTTTEKQIAAVFLDPEACELISTTFWKRGDELDISSDHAIEPIRRSNGIRWNNWATEYRVIAPERWFIVGVKYPYQRETSATRSVQTATGGKRIIREKMQETVEVVHTPYCEELRTADMVARGIAYLHDVVARARDRLRDQAVRSHAFPELLVTDVPQLAAVLTMRRASNEHMDPTEFASDPAHSADRIHVIIAANGPDTGSHTCSAAQACGLWQFTEGTYREMRRLYPEANLLDDFSEGWRDHVNVASAALLLDDNNLAELVEEFGTEIAADALLEEYLAAAYNAGVPRVIAALRVARTEGVAEWTDARGSRCGRRGRVAQCLPRETRDYIAKLRYLRDQWPERSCVFLRVNTDAGCSGL